MSNCSRKPDIVIIGKTAINFSTLNTEKYDKKCIEENNRRLFEILNPTNKFAKERAFSSVCYYDKSFKGKQFSFINTITTIRKYADRYGNSKQGLNKLKEMTVHGDNMFLTKLRTALVSDLGVTKLVLILSDETVNPVDFFFTSDKDYGNGILEGIQLKEKFDTKDYFANPDSFVLTVHFNIAYVIRRLYNDFYKKEMFEKNNILWYHDTLNELENSMSYTLWAAIYKDNFRMINTEKFMFILKLLSEGNFESANTLNAASHNTIRDLLSKEDNIPLTNEVRTFRKIYAGKCQAMGIMTRESDMSSIPFSTVSCILHDVDINPCTFVSVLEPGDNEIRSFLLSVVKKCGESDRLIPMKFASTNDLKTINFENRGIKELTPAAVSRNYILMMNYLPASLIIAYYFQNGENYNIVNTMLNSLVSNGECNYYELQNESGLNHIVKSLNTLFSFIDELRSSFTNPLKITHNVKHVLKAALDSNITIKDESEVQ